MYFLVKKKKKRKTPGDIVLHLCTKNLHDIIYSFWDIECDRLKLVVMGHFLPFYFPPKIPNCWRYHFVYQKLWSDNVRFLRYCVYRKMDRLMDVRTDGQTDRQTDRQRDRQTDRQKKWQIRGISPPKNLIKTFLVPVIVGFIGNFHCDWVFRLF